MTTGTKIIKRALSKIQSHSVMSEATPEAIEDSMFELNSMMDELRTRGILTKTNILENHGDDLGEPEDCTNAIVYNLAVRRAPDHNRPVSDTLSALAEHGMDFIERNYEELNIPDMVPSSTLPMGQGNKGGLRRSRTFHGRGSKIGD